MAHAESFDFRFSSHKLIFNFNSHQSSSNHLLPLFIVVQLDNICNFDQQPDIRRSVPPSMIGEVSSSPAKGVNYCPSTVQRGVSKHTSVLVRCHEIYLVQWYTAVCICMCISSYLYLYFCFCLYLYAANTEMVWVSRCQL